MKISDLNQLNECADFIYRAGVTVTPVAFYEASELLMATQELGKIVERLNLPPAWVELYRLNKVLYYRLAGGICSPADVMGDMESQLRLCYSEIKRSSDGISQEALQILSQIVLPDEGLWARLLKVEHSPFFLIIQNKIEDAIRRGQSNLGLVLRDNRLRESTKKLLMSLQLPINITVRKSNELRNHPRLDRVFYFGSLRSLRWHDEEFLLRAPVTDELEFFELSHSGTIQNAGLDLFALDPGNCFSLNKAPAAGVVEDFKPRTSNQVADEEFEGVHYVDSDEADFDGNIIRSVDSFRAILGGGYGANLGSESSIFIAHCRIRGLSITCTKIEKKNVVDLEPGDLVVLTTEGSGDMIAPYADQIIGPRAKTFRELQRAWKRELAELVVEIGTPQVINKLRLASGFDISSTSIHQWLGESVHGPAKERTQLFDSVLKLLNRSDKISIHNEALNQIRDSSMKAGHRLQSELRDKLLGMDLSRVLSSGFMEFRLEANGPAKTIFELQKLDATIRPENPYKINRVFKLRRVDQLA